MSEIKTKKIKIAWAITGAGDKIAEIVEIMKDLKVRSDNIAEIDVYISKNADTMLKFYRLDDEVNKSFSKVWVETSSNIPFLAGMMQSGKYKFMLIMPASSNSVAKIVNSIGDTLITNSALMALKAFVPVWIMPVDYKESIVSTKLPNGSEMKMQVRKKDADHVRELLTTEGVRVFENPQEVRDGYLEWLKTL